MRSKLVIILPVPAVVEPGGSFILPIKLVKGVEAFVSGWGSDVLVLLERAETQTNNLDNRSWSREELPCRFEIVAFEELSSRWNAELDSAVVLAFADHRLHRLAGMCRKRSVPYVVHTELSLRTQFQILFADQPSVRARARTGLWLLLNHVRTLMTLRRAAGLQCNGTPTFLAYRRLVDDTLLYFDTRTSAGMMASAAGIRSRLIGMRERKSVRLLFSGRLIEIKGVLHLIDVAEHLRDDGLEFELLIAGDGHLRDTIESRVAAAGLQGQVRCLGTLDFKTELAPFMRDQIDLFVCPHLQGDPSCTYLETMSAGVPIVGYANEAFRGLHEICGVGWQVPRGRADLLARQIASIARQPDRLAEHSLAALAFASEHAFEAEFDRRIGHLSRFRNWAVRNAGAEGARSGLGHLDSVVGHELSK